MPRYESRPKAWWDDGLPEHRTITVHESREPVDTGLLDSCGVPIYRMPEPIGFRLEAAKKKVKERKRTR